MNYTVFGRTNIRVSRLGFGAMGLGGSFGHYDDEYLIRSVLLSLEKGVNFIDTARAYNRSEEVIGKALKEWRGERPFIATKVLPQPAPSSYPAMSGWHHPAPVEMIYPTNTIRRSVEESLRQLDTDTIDLVQLHNYWPTWDTRDYWMEELVRLKEEGKLRFIGISVPDHRAELAISLVRSGHIDSVQAVVNIFDPIALDCLVPICKENGVGVIARAILDEGGLTGFLKQDTVFPDGDFRKHYFDVLPRNLYIDKVDKLRAYIPEYADTLAELAVKFALYDPDIHVCLTSMHVHEYAEQNIAVVDKPALPAEIFERLRIKHRWIRNFYQARRHLDV